MSASPRASLTASAPQPPLAPGSQSVVIATIVNRGRQPEDFRLGVRGIEPGWVTFRPLTLTLGPGEQATVSIAIQLPADAAPGNVTPVIRLIALSSASVVAEAVAGVDGETTASPAAATGARPAAPAAVETDRPGTARSRSRTWLPIAAIAGVALLLVALVGGLVYFFLSGPEPAPPGGANATVCAGQGTKLVRLFSDDTTTAIRISNPDLSEGRILRTEPAETLPGLYDPLLSLSGDNARLAYVTASNEAMDDAHIWYIDVAEPSRRQELAAVPRGLWVVKPAWSPDKRRLAFVKLDEDLAAQNQTGLELWIAEVGGQPRKVGSPAELRPEVFYGQRNSPLCWGADNATILLQDGAVAGVAGNRQFAIDVASGSVDSVPASPQSTPAVQDDLKPPTASGGECSVPVFSQNDPAWRNLIMQSAGDAIGNFGCALTATTMLLNYYGAALTPAQLNACLGAAADPLYWASAPACTDGIVGGGNQSDFTWQRLDEVLGSGAPAIVGMVRGQTGMHFVVVTAGGGGNSADYAVSDPWDASTHKTLQYFFNTGYNPRWIITYSGPGRGCTRVVGVSGGVPRPGNEPALAPAQLLPIFARAAQLTGVPQEVLLAIARVESGFQPRAVGPFLSQFAGTEDQHARGMMQFLSSSYRPYVPRIDAATGKGLGLEGIWDAESSIYAAAFYLQDNGASGGQAGDLRRAIFAYNHADWYVDKVLAWAAHYAGGAVPDPNLFDPNGGARPGTLAGPTTSPGVVGIADGGVSRDPVNLNPTGDGASATITNLAPGNGAGPGGTTTPSPASPVPGDRRGYFGLLGRAVPLVNRPIVYRNVAPGTVVGDEGVYQVVITSKDRPSGVTRVKFTIDRTPPLLDIALLNSAGNASRSGTVAGARPLSLSAGAATQAGKPQSRGPARLQILYQDRLSGVATIEYRLDEGPWQEYANVTSFMGTRIVEAPGDHAIAFRATDLAGNTSPVRSFAFTVLPDSATPPTPTSTSTSLPASPLNPTVPLPPTNPAGPTVRVTPPPTVTTPQVTVTTPRATVTTPRVTVTTPRVTPAPRMRLNPPRLDFPAQPTGTSSRAQTITVTNSGPGPLRIAGVAISGSNAGDFGILPGANSCAGATVAPGQSCTLGVVFSPRAVRQPPPTRAATLTITGDASNSPQTVSLSGTEAGPG